MIISAILKFHEVALIVTRMYQLIFLILFGNLTEFSVIFPSLHYEIVHLVVFCDFPDQNLKQRFHLWSIKYFLNAKTGFLTNINPHCCYFIYFSCKMEWKLHKWKMYKQTLSGFMFWSPRPWNQIMGFSKIEDTVKALPLHSNGILWSKEACQNIIHTLKLSK